ncbi:e3 ubiquitin ligase ARI4 [Fusarium beomiforme]|uniref:E3 ubiquitin ligase ARI4 n=1 Tax=Fusarium beomiforme TaxID=44412 RepID=A0A9P5APJ6_9HYPO|nr:e3 ubiquitin ligase ARI4 [Fusarium beomiforme]
MSNVSDAFDRVHPDLVDLMIRLDLLPAEQDNGLSESNLARIIQLALELADPVEQALLVSRIITDEDMALRRLRSPEVQNTNYRVVLDRAERRAAFMEEANDSAPARGNGEECLICADGAHVRAPCGCNYCLSCYREAIRVGLRSQEEFPPKCCNPFDVAAIELARSPALVHIFRQMQEEADAPIHERLYCHDGNCAAFIPPDRNGHCLFCDTHTCRDCGARAHPGRPCQEGDAEEDVWATMDDNRTVNCPNCGRMIQLSEACNHMTCVCGREFCFICGEDWHTCDCPLYGGFHLMVPIRDRPGAKPPQFRRRPRRTEAAAVDNTDGPLRIPQLRPQPGEEDRAPVDVGGPRRVIRPLRLPPPQERREERHREERHHGGHHNEGHHHGHRPHNRHRHDHGHGHRHHYEHEDRHRHDHEFPVYLSSRDALLLPTDEVVRRRTEENFRDDYLRVGIPRNPPHQPGVYRDVFHGVGEGPIANQFLPAQYRYGDPNLRDLRDRQEERMRGQRQPRDGPTDFFDFRHEFEDIAGVMDRMRFDDQRQPAVVRRRVPWVDPRPERAGPDLTANDRIQIRVANRRAQDLDRPLVRDEPADRPANNNQRFLEMNRAAARLADILPPRPEQRVGDMRPPGGFGIAARGGNNRDPEADDFEVYADNFPYAHGNRNPRR